MSRRGRRRGRCRDRHRGRRRVRGRPAPPRAAGSSRATTTTRIDASDVQRAGHARQAAPRSDGVDDRRARRGPPRRRAGRTSGRRARRRATRRARTRRRRRRARSPRRPPGGHPGTASASTTHAIAGAERAPARAVRRHRPAAPGRGSPSTGTARRTPRTGADGTGVGSACVPRSATASRHPGDPIAGRHDDRAAAPTSGRHAMPPDASHCRTTREQCPHRARAGDDGEHRHGGRSRERRAGRAAIAPWARRRASVLGAPSSSPSAAVAGSLYAWDAGYEGRVLPGVSVGSTSLAGMDRDEAAAAIDAAYPYGDGRLVLRTPDGDIVIPYAAVARRADVDALVDRAMAAGTGGRHRRAAWSAEVRLALDGTSLDPAVALDEALLAARIENAVYPLRTPPVDATIEMTSKGIVIGRARTGRDAEPAPVVAAAAAALARPGGAGRGRRPGRHVRGPARGRGRDGVRRPRPGRAHGEGDHDRRQEPFLEDQGVDRPLVDPLRAHRRRRHRRRPRRVEDPDRPWPRWRRPSRSPRSPPSTSSRGRAGSSASSPAPRVASSTSRRRPTRSSRSSPPGPVGTSRRRSA